MYIFLPYVIFVITLFIIAVVVTFYYEYKEFCRKESKRLPLIPFIKHIPHIIFSKRKNVSSKKNKHWWEGAYFYLGIIGYILIGAIIYLLGLLTMVGIGYLLMLFN